jgi:lectin family protein
MSYPVSRTKYSQSSSATRLCLLCFVLVPVLLLPLKVDAQQRITWHEIVWQDDFSSPGKYPYYITDNSSYNTQDGYFVLTPREVGVAGRIFITAPEETQYFDLHFDAFFGNKTGNVGGADGLVAVFAPRYIYPSSYGESMNFDGCGGFGMEFDTYHDGGANDPNAEHMALIRDNTANHIHSELFADGELEDDQWHSIHLTNSDGLVKMFFDGQSRFSYQLQGFSSFNGYFGFTAATATSFNAHYIDNVVLTVPARTLTDFGTFSPCLPVFVDTVIEIENNLPDNEALQIDSVRILHLQGTEAFSISSVISQTTLQTSEILSIPVSFAGNDEGIHSALLVAYSSRGERIVDTLRITLELPPTSWSPQTVVFPRTHLSTSSERSVWLINNGTSRATVGELHSTWNEFAILEPSVFPVSILPGDSIEVIVRFTPLTTGTKNALLQVLNSCGSFKDALLTADGFLDLLQFKFDAPLMLLPNQSGYQQVLLSSNPMFMDVQELSVYLNYDPDVVRFINIDLRQSILPSTANVETSLLGSGNILVYIWTNEMIQTNGNLFDLQFQDNVGDFACADVRIDTVIVNLSSTTPGIPFSTGDTSTTCINASCRVPGGLIKLSGAQMNASPNPFRDAVSASLSIPSDYMVHVYIRDSFGRKVAKLHEGFLEEGSYSFRHNGFSFSNGVYFLVAKIGNETLVTPIVRQD